MPVGLVSHSGSLERGLGNAAADLVDIEVDLDVQIDGDGFATFPGGLELVLLHDVNSFLIECERGCPVHLVDCVCDGFNDMYVHGIAVGVHDEGHGCNSVDLLLSRNFSVLQLGLEDTYRRGDAAPNLMRT